MSSLQSKATLVKETQSVRIGSRYRPERVAELIKDSDIDHLVIGSGVGGLICAAALAKVGRKVLVLEQHYTAGGFTHSYLRKGYEWDVGVHYVGQVGNKKTLPGALFHWLSEGRLEWDSLGACYDAFDIAGKRYQLPVGKSAFKRYLLKQFPDDAGAIVEYCQLLFHVERWLPFFFSSKISSLSWLNSDWLNGDWLNAGWLNGKWFDSSLFNKIRIKSSADLIKRNIPQAFYQTTAEVLDDLTDNKTLKAVLTAQWGDAGLPPGQSSFFLHCLIANHYLAGAWYPKGGSSQIAESLLPTIEGAGGKVMTYAEVEGIVLDDSEQASVAGVKMADGHIIKCDSVISGCGWYNTQKLLPENALSAINKEVAPQQIEPSACHICLYVGFEESPQALKIPTNNLWVHRSENYDADCAQLTEGATTDLPFVYISSSAARDSTWNQRYPDKAVMELVAVIPYREFEPWSGTDWGKRGDDYEAKKEYWSEKLLLTLYQHFPQLKGKVTYYELSTPLSTEHFMNYPRGEIYGLAHTPRRYQQEGLKPTTNIHGLTLVGQDALTSGVVGAAMSGAIGAGEILGADTKRTLMRPVKWLASWVKTV